MLPTNCTCALAGLMLASSFLSANAGPYYPKDHGEPVTEADSFIFSTLNSMTTSVVGPRMYDGSYFSSRNSYHVSFRPGDEIMHMEVNNITAIVGRYGNSHKHDSAYEFKVGDLAPGVDVRQERTNGGDIMNGWWLILACRNGQTCISTLDSNDNRTGYQASLSLEFDDPNLANRVAKAFHDSVVAHGGQDSRY